MISEISHFLLNVLASVCGILIASALVGALEQIRRNRKQKKDRRLRR